MAPPSDLDTLPLNVLLVTVRLPPRAIRIAPPLSVLSLLLLKVQVSIVRLPVVASEKTMAPPTPVDWLPVTTHPVRVHCSLPAAIAPPAAAVFPPERVNPLSWTWVAVAAAVLLKI